MSNLHAGEKARIQTFPLKVHDKGECLLKFYYHMFGESLGELNINVLVGGNRTRFLRKTYNDASKFLWRKTVIDLSNETDIFQVEFEGEFFLILLPYFV